VTGSINIEFILWPVAFLLGICVGSFLNVMADRVPAGKSLLHPPSHCFSCGHALEPRDLFPILSYLMLRGRCRYCGQSIPVRSMLVELTTGLLFVLALTVFGLTWQALVTMVYGSFFITLFITDLELGLLPHFIVYPGIAAALAFAALRPLTGTTPGILSALAGLGVSFGAFFLIWALSKIFKKDILGFGDVGTAGLIGASVGYPSALVALSMALLAGVLTAAMLVVFKVRRFNEPLQFGMFLAFGGIVCLFCGQDIMDALRQLLTL
jgi:leader peptidase (prepilin peptidase)/N-methyltransferase